MITFLSDKKSPEMILTSQVAATTPSIPVSENGSNCLSSLQWLLLIIQLIINYHWLSIIVSENGSNCLSSAIIMINYSIDNQLLSIINYCFCNGSNYLSSLQGRWDGDCEVKRLSTMNVPLFLPAHEFGFQEVSASSIVFELPLSGVKHKSPQEASVSQLTLS